MLSIFILKFEWIDADTTSHSFNISSGRSRDPSFKISNSTPFKILKPRSFEFNLSISSNSLMISLAVCPPAILVDTVWSVIAIYE